MGALGSAPTRITLVDDCERSQFCSICLERAPWTEWALVTLSCARCHHEHGRWIHAAECCIDHMRKTKRTGAICASCQCWGTVDFAAYWRQVEAQYVVPAICQDGSAIAAIYRRLCFSACERGIVAEIAARGKPRRNTSYCDCCGTLTYRRKLVVQPSACPSCDAPSLELRCTACSAASKQATRLCLACSEPFRV